MADGEVQKIGLRKYPLWKEKQELNWNAVQKLVILEDSLDVTFCTTVQGKEDQTIVHGNWEAYLHNGTSSYSSF